MGLLSTLLGNKLRDPLGLYRDTGSAAPGITQPQGRQPSNPDWDDLVNTVIAEAGGEGTQGMAAVASVIKNRAAARGLTPAEVVRQPHQFAGYENPGPGSQKGQRDPALRAEAEDILRKVLGGEMPDPTGGADHFHSGAAPDWAASMRKTASIGGHQFYSSAKPAPASDPFSKILAPQDPQPGEVPNPDGKGLARLVRPTVRSADDETAIGAISLDNLPTIDASAFDDLTKEGATWNFGSLKANALVIHHTGGRGSVAGVVQTFKDRGYPAHFVIDRQGHIHQVLGLDQRGRHTRNSKINDITNSNSWGVEIIAKDDSDVNPAQVKAALELTKFLHQDFGLPYDRVVGHGEINSHKQATEGHTVIAALRGGSQQGNEAPVTVDVGFKANDPMGLYAGRDNPFAAKVPTLRPFHPGEQVDNGDGTVSTEISTTWQLPDGSWVNVPSLWMDDRTGKPRRFDPADEQGILGAMADYEKRTGETLPRFRSLEEAEASAQARSDAGGAAAGTQAGAEADATAETLNAAEPGRYEVVDADRLTDWQQQWEADHRSTGLLGDAKRLLSAGWKGLGLAAREAVEQIGNSPVLPGNLAKAAVDRATGRREPGAGSMLVRGLDAVDEWMRGDGVSAEQALQRGIEADVASLTPETAASREKLWWDREKMRPGPAWTDPRSYFAGITESLPGTVLSMGPSMLLAKSAYGAALAKGVTEKIAAAAAARTAMIAGAVSEGIMGGGQAAATVRDQVRRLPPEVLAKSESYQHLIASGMSESDAIEALASDAATQAYVVGGIATGAFGGMGDRVLAKIIAEGVGGSVVKRLVSGALREGVAEGVLEEAPQEAAQQAAQNWAMRDANPDQPLMEGVPEAAAGGLAVGGAMGVGMGAAGGVASPRKGPLARAIEHGAQQGAAGERYTVTDPAVADGKPGELDGQSVTLAPDQSNAPEGMRRVIGADGAPRLVDEQLLAPQERGGGPLEKAPVRARQAPVTGAVPDGAPPVRTTVRVDVPGAEPFMASIEGYEAGEAMVWDASTGEVLQVPLDAITPIADAPSRDAPAPAQPVAGVTTTEMPPPEEQKPAREKFPPLAPGDRVVVDDEHGGRFAARVDSTVEEGGSEVLVTRDDGTSQQVPLNSVHVSKLTRKQVEQQEIERNPPAARDEPPPTPSSRRVGAATVEMPDETHAKLYDLGKLRRESAATLGRGSLDREAVDPTQQKRLADALGIPVEAAGQIADDYRYRVERAARNRRSDLPIKMHGIDDRRLKQWQAERRRAEAEAEAGLDPERWWDGELTAAGRRSVLASSGIKRSEKTLWKNLPKSLQDRLWKARDAAAGDTDAAAHEAATSPENALPEPSQAQKEAGNYKLGHLRLGGLDLSIENPAGSTRSGVDRGGKKWSVRMKSHYGYIKGTVGRDKDHIDVFVKPGTDALDDAAAAFVVDQRNADGGFDEHKVMLGFGDEASARAAYLENYTKGWKGLGELSQTTLADFKRWLVEGDTRRQFAKWKSERGRPANRPVPEEAKSTFSPIEKRASDVYARLWDDAKANPTEISRTAEWGRQLVEQIINPSRHHPVVEEPNPRGLKIGDAVTVGGARKYVVSVKKNGTHEQAKLAGIDGYPGWYDLDRIDGAPGGPKPAETVADRVAKAREATPASPTKKTKPNLSRKQHLDRLENYFRPGRIVEGYGGPDRVDAFERLADGNWQVRVVRVDAQGNPTEALRTHATDPSPRELARWEVDHPVPGTAAKTAKPTDKYSESIPAAANTPKAVVEKLTQWGAENKLVTRDRAAEIRRRLQDKLKGQLNAGIDPEVLALGAELAAFHIEAGARRFSTFAKAIAEDMGSSIEKLRPYLRAWYNAARDLMEDGGLSIEGMDDAAAVRAELDRLAGEGPDEPAQLDRARPPALAGAPAEQVSGTVRGRNARPSAAGSGEPDLFGGEPARGGRVSAGRGVADGPREPSPAAGGKRRTDAGARPDAVASDGSRGRERPADDAGRLAPPATAATQAAQQPTDYAITDADAIGGGGQKAKFRNNVAAIRLLRTLDAEARPATRDEQTVLAKWVGWGGLRSAFPREDGSVAKGWEKEAADLKELLTPEEYRAAEASTRNAHYTSPEVVKAIWSAVDRLGFRGGQALEPSVGAGNFVGLMPGKFKAGTYLTGVELDHITGGIAKNLYPHANIQAPRGFEALQIPDGHFDLAIGNPPFGSEKVYDAERRHLNRFSIHNFFFAKSVEGLRPGGILAMVVTNYFLDAADARARRHIADRAKLLGAIRLPNNAFLQNAGTEVTTDIVLLQKRREGEIADVSWVDVGTFTDKEGRKVPLNSYFVDHPDMMLGEFGAYGTMYRGDEAALVARDGDDLPALLESAISRLPADVMPEPGASVAPETVTVPASAADALIGSLFLADDGAIHIRKADHLGRPQSEAVTLPTDKARERVAGMVRIRDAFARLRRAQIDETASDDQVAKLRGQLNKVYDAFVSSHGPVNADANKRLFRDDPTWPQVAALEDGFDKGVSQTIAARTGEAARPASARKAAIFSKRTQQPYRRPTSAASAKDALATVLADRGRVDVDEMVRLYRKGPEEIVRELGPLLYRTPAGAYETADQYLSGNVKKKLAEAERAAERDPDFRRNVEALRDVIPADIEAVDIDVKAGAPWVPASDVAAFLDHITGTKGGRATYSALTAKWQVDPARTTEAAETQWGTARAAVARILDAAMNGQSVTVYDKVGDRAVLNAAETDAANAKVEKVKAEWRRWLWDDDDRRPRLARLYNDTYNTDILRQYDGSHLTLPGKVSDDVISLRPHQKNAVWRALQSSTVLFDHVVGAGKTFAVIAAVMEKRRTGQARKPMVVVPNHLVGQWAADFVKLYPGARILAATKKDFEAENRKKLFARVATGDWDAVIVAHSSFGKMPVSPEFERRFIERQIEQLEQAEAVLRGQDGKKSRNVAQVAKWRENMEAKLKRLLDAGAKDVGMTFEEMGVDMIVVDEAHEFKNLAFPTSMTRVAGLGNPTGSQKAADLYMKIQSVRERTGGNNIMFATGTPLSNTMAEMFTVQRYLDGEALENLAIGHFDAWARVFGEVVSDWELSPSGQYKLNSRFAKFVNLPELMQRYLSFADVITNDDIKAQLAAVGKTLPLPKVKGGKPDNVVVDRSPDQAAYIGEGKADEHGNLVFPQGSLVWRAEHLPKGRMEPGADNMLKVMSDARKAALDMRLIDPSYRDYRGSKVHRAADRMVDIYRRWAEKRGTQLVFIDLSTPKRARAREEARIRDLMQRAEAGDEAAQETLDAMSPDEFEALNGSFSVYDDLRQKLVDRGIPDAEIAFIHDANTEVQKEELFGKVRAGRVRFLFGSTPKMGAGTNVQNRLVALHHLDAPWRPSDLEQRDGRGIRQGNELYAEDPEGFEIEILRYATKNTLDARQWQTIEGKARFIQQVRKGDVKARVIEDIAGEAANAAEMKAAASGNPLILEEMDLRHKLRKLEGQQAEHEREQHRIKARIRSMEDIAETTRGRLPAIRDDAERAERAIEAGLAGEVRGQAVEKPKELGEAVLGAARTMLLQGSQREPLGRLGEFNLSLEHAYHDVVTLTIDGAEAHTVKFDVADQDETGLGMQIRNTVRKLPDGPAAAEDRIADIARQIPALERQIVPWAGAAELEQTAGRHREVLAKLQPRQSAGAPASPPADAKASTKEPVAVVLGDELGVDFRGPQDMPALRKAALAWYRAHLVGTTATVADGTVVSFNRRGGNKSTAGKGDRLLRAVPAIKAIIEGGEVVLREPGRDPNTVRERLIVAAPVSFMGETLRLAVSIHSTPDGRFQYDLNPDTGARSPGVGVPGEPTTGKPSTQSAVEGASDGINLFYWRPESNEAAGNSVRQELERGPFGSTFGRLATRGVIRVVADAPGKPAGWQAWTDPDGTINLVDGRIAAGEASAVLLHEAFHAGVRPLLGDASWGKLMRRLDALHRQFRQSGGAAHRFWQAARDRVARAGVDGDLAAEEFGAYAIEEYEAAPGAVRRWVDDVAGAVKAWLLRRFGRQLGAVTPAQLRALAVAALRDRNGHDTHSRAKASVAAARTAVTPERITRELSGRLTDLQPSVLAAIPLNYFTELARPGMAAVGDYLRVKRLLDAYRGRKHADADAIAQEWLKYARLGFGGKGKAKAAELANLMHDATLAGVDPSKADPETRAQPAYADLRHRYQALAPAGRALFQRVRDAYSSQADELDRILLDNVRKANEIAQRRAEAEYAEQVQRINRARMSPEAREDALDEAEKDFKARSTRALWSMKARITKLRMAFEASRVAEPYFPLARFGRYFVAVRDVDGTVLSFSRRERAADRDRLAADMRKAYPTSTVDVGVMESASEVRAAMDPRLVAEIEQIVGGTGLDPTSMTAVLDQIWQRYLQTMPDLSTRKRFIHRKGTAGFDADALRAFSSHMFHAAHQMARLKYGMELQELVNETADQARKADDTTAAMTLANELKKRHAWVMNPTGGKVAQTMTSAAFVWYLGTTPAAAIVNMTQTPMLGIPILAGRFGGFAKASAAILKASYDSIAGRGSVTRAGLKPDEVAALEAFYDSGLIDRTQSHDLAGVGETGVEYSPLRAKVMAVMSWAFHRAEVWNREVTALAAYRMARAAGQNQSEAIDSAHDLTWKVHFDYSNSSRPRIMQNDFAKVALVFRSYNINMLYRLFRDTKQAFRGETPQARREARYQLAGVLGMMSLLSGVTGVAGFNLAMALAGLVLGDDDDPMDFEQQFRKAVLDILGPQLGGVVLHGVPGHYLGIDLTSRIGMPDLWFRSPSRDLQGQDEYDYWVLNSLGATVSLGGDIVRGVGLIMDGDVARGVETVSPKWVRDLMKSWRYANEGLTSLKGDELMPADQFDPWSLIAQSMGFTPAKVSETYERNNALKNAERRVLDRRRKLINAYAVAVKTGDDDARREVIEQIGAFNASPQFRAVRITPDSLRQSLAVRQRNARKREDGVLIQNPRLGKQLRDALPERVY